MLQDLCGRLPYGVEVYAIEICKSGKVVSINTTYGIVQFSTDNQVGITERAPISDIKPYLRPMDSMTEEEQIQLGRLLGATSYNLLNGDYFYLKELLEYIYKSHIDLFGLIPMGLALEAPEGMYK